MWRWDQAEPFGNNPADENPSELGAFYLPLRLPGQRYDAETGLHYNYRSGPTRLDSSGGVYKCNPGGLRVIHGGACGAFTHTAARLLVPAA